MGGSPVILSKTHFDTKAGLFSNYLVNWKINQFLTVFKMFILFLGLCTTILALPSWVYTIYYVESAIMFVDEAIATKVTNDVISTYC